MSAKHTPGAWTVDGSEGDLVVHTIGAKGNSPICTLEWEIFSRVEANANARLIAAAPEMLQLIKDVFKYLQSVEEGIPPGAPSVEQFEMVIAKAEGQVMNTCECGKPTFMIDTVYGAPIPSDFCVDCDEARAGKEEAQS